MIVKLIWAVIPLVFFSITGIPELFADEFTTYQITDEDDVLYTITDENQILRIVKILDSSSLEIFIKAISDGNIAIKMPHDLIGVGWAPGCYEDDFFVIIDGEEAFPINDEFTVYDRIITIPFRQDDSKIEIVPGLVPESWMYFDKCMSKQQSSSVAEEQIEVFLPPLIQIKNGILPENVACNKGLEKIFKLDGSPACVKPSTAEKLIQRGWAAMPEQNISETPEPIISEIDFTTIINANNQFALDFYSKVTKDNEDNIFYSPWSISTAFAIAYEGTRGNTADEISQVFGFPTDDNQRRNEFKSAINDLNQKDAKYNMTVANALWIADFFEPIQEYVDTAKIYYDSEVSKVDFVSTEGVKTINEWVKQKTEEKIDKVLVEGSTNELTRLVITNAIYFKGNWLTQFDEENTSDDDFWIGLDENVQVPMMRLEPTYFNYTKTDQLQVLELPYEGDKLSMLVLLPNEKDSLGAVEEELTVENLSRWKDNLSLTETIVFLPKFTLETKYDLIPSLESLGMPTAFQEGVADFSGITELERLYIAQAIHKAFVDVNEEGTEAAAVTAIEIVTTSEPVYEIFKADHPFIFIIQDNETDNILFLGRVINPE